MIPFKKIIFSFILLSFVCTTTKAQKGKRIIKPNTSQNIDSLIIAQQKILLEKIELQQTKDSIKYAQQWLKDSVMYAKQDSIRAIKDSIEWQQKLVKIKEVYRNYRFPADSLKYVDDKVAKLIPPDFSAEADSAVSIINKNFISPLHKARAIFYVVSSRITYNYGAMNLTFVPLRIKDKSALYTFRVKTGVCQDYSELYTYMCEKAGLECVTIIGWGKNYPYAIKVLEKTNHAWNAVKIKDKWILLDATWAHLENKDFIDTYWFNTNPSEFIYSHLPEDSKWQLQDRPFSKLQFINYPIVDPGLFQSKLDLEIPSNGTMQVKDGKFSVNLDVTEPNYSFSFSIIPYQGDDWQQFNTKLEWQELPKNISLNKKEGIRTFNAILPKKGVWWLAISIDRKIKNKYLQEVSFPQCMILKMIY